MKYDGKVAAVAGSFALENIVVGTGLDIGAGVKLVEVTRPVVVGANYYFLITGRMLDAAK